MACLERLLTISPAEQRVLVLLLNGANNRAIAAQLGLSPRTVESHISAMLEKTGCRSRTQLVLWELMKRQHETRGSMTEVAGGSAQRWCSGSTRSFA